MPEKDGKENKSKLFLRRIRYGSQKIRYESTTPEIQGPA